jgi:dienelactone hydrolase
VQELRLTVDAGDRKVPAVVWWPEDLGAGSPLVLVGHGGTLHKTSPQVVATAEPLLDSGAVVAAIDGPVHGERRPGGADPDDMDGVWRDFVEMRERVGLESVARSMTEDWRAALDHLLGLPGLAGRRVGYWGLSMGGRYGVPFVAAEPRVGAAVLGLVATNAQPSILADAERITCPVLFVLDTDDELFPLAGGIDLFLALGSQDKRLHVFPGPHGAMPPDERAVMRDFLLDRLS